MMTLPVYVVTPVFSLNVARSATNEIALLRSLGNAKAKVETATPKLSASVCLRKVFEIENPRDYIVVRGIGSAGRKTFIFREKNSNKAFIVCGCFNGSLQEFIKEVNKEYPAKNAKDPVLTYRKEYLSLINMIRAKERMWMKERREKDTEIEEYFNAIKETSIPLF